jgi:hypothetical protein
MKVDKIPDRIKYPEIAACGLSCVICPAYVMTTKSRCPGCKTDWRLGGPCALLYCVVRKDDIEFCWECPDGETCQKWQKHREFSKNHDSFISYYALEDNVAYARKHGADAFAKRQAEKATILHMLLDEFNEGRSKSYYCRAVTVLETSSVRSALTNGRRQSAGLDLKAKAKLMHAILDGLAEEQNRSLTLREPPPKAKQSQPGNSR